MEIDEIETKENFPKMPKYYVRFLAEFKCFAINREVANVGEIISVQISVKDKIANIDLRKIFCNVNQRF